MRYRVRHTTTYNYSAPVTLCYNMTHLLPRNTENQRCISKIIHVSPIPLYQREGQDYFGNPTFYFSIQEPHQKLTINVVSYFDVKPHSFSQWVEKHTLTCGELRSLLKEPETSELRLAKEFCLNSSQVVCSDALRDYALPFFPDDTPVLQAVRNFTQHIFTEFTFDPTATDVTTPPEVVLQEKKGVCQDFAHLAIGCLRSAGFAARYVSGYIETLPPPGQEKLVGSDASHAWFAVFIPELGWVEFDPTNNIVPIDQHIVTGWGRDYADVTPIQGVIFDGGDSHSLAVAVDVERLS